jgi:hypothetical protein
VIVLVFLILITHFVFLYNSFFQSRLLLPENWLRRYVLQILRLYCFHYYQGIFDDSPCMNCLRRNTIRSTILSSSSMTISHPFKKERSPSRNTNSECCKATVTYCLSFRMTEVTILVVPTFYQLLFL